MMLIELSVVLAADQCDPSFLNPDFLRCSGIVADNMQMKEPPVLTPALQDC